MAALGAILAALGALSSELLLVASGLAAAVVGVALYWASGWFWDWYWDWLERLQSGEVESTATLRTVLVVLFVAWGTGAFVGLWWIAGLVGVVTDGALAGNPVSVVTVAGGVVPGVAFGGGLFALARRRRSRNASLDVTKGSRGFRLIVAITSCALGAYCLLLYAHPPSAVAFAVAYLVSFVAGAVVYLSRAGANPSAA